MIEVPAHLELAAWLIGHEMGDSLTVAEAAERARQKLLTRLGRLITPSGCDALSARATHLACAEYEFLGQSTEGIDADLLLTGFTFLLVQLIELVALFIGEYLMGRLLIEVWPEVPGLTPMHQSVRGLNRQQDLRL